jgi:UDP-N-acetylglucosamine--N-acetylmuramyl-(pentapeptide) pyrophosphoryl-undecaprenol N-acetylglucosamine transferase
LYPGIAVAREVLRRMPDAVVSFAGTTRGLEARVVPAAGFELDTIRSAGLKGRSLTARLRGAALVPAGLLDAWRLLTRRRPQVVMGVGGYSSGPVVLAAALRRIPTLVLEQNAVPGLTNRLLAPWVRAAAVTYEQTLSFFGRRGFVAGNPVRAEFFQHSKSEGRTSSSRRVLVLGGSQGAHAINVAMVAAAPELVRRSADVAVVHQTGERDLETVREGYPPRRPSSPRGILPGYRRTRNGRSRRRDQPGRRHHARGAGGVRPVRRCSCRFRPRPTTINARTPLCSIAPAPRC